MLVEFEVGNYRSFKDPVRLSMVAANPIKEFLEENTFQAWRYRLLKSAAIYGANASGKSNLLHAMAFMRGFVLSSSKEMQAGEPIRVVPFKFNTATENAPSRFETSFLLKDRRYRYGFEADRKAVRKEWLYYAEKQKEEHLFLREEDDIEVGVDFGEGKTLEEKTRSNALFLSVVAQFNGETAGMILKWFLDVGLLHGLQDMQYGGFTASLLQDEALRPRLLDFIQRADVGIENLTVSEKPLDEEALKRLPEQVQDQIRKQKPRIAEVSAVHSKFRDGVKEGLATTDFFSEESDGTKKLFCIAGPLLESLTFGRVVVLDELDARLHPLLTKAVVRLFNSSVSNPNNAQLIFATHDTNLLDNDMLRRDQIWFTEKTQQGATALYSLAEMKVRNDASFEKNYIAGRYGAIPFLGGLAALPMETGDGPSRQIH